MQNNNQEGSLGGIEEFKEQDIKFSHQALVMRALNNCIEKGSKEMRKGYNVAVEDNKGNTKIVYNEDTRLSFIETVKTAKAMMICDFDKNTEKEIKKLVEETLKIKKVHLHNQKFWFDSLSYDQKQNLINDGLSVVPNMFNVSDRFPPFYEYYVLNNVNIYRKILEELIKLTKNLEFYGKESTGT